MNSANSFSIVMGKYNYIKNNVNRILLMSLTLLSLLFFKDIGVCVSVVVCSQSCTLELTDLEHFTADIETPETLHGTYFHLA